MFNPKNFFSKKLSPPQTSTALNKKHREEVIAKASVCLGFKEFKEYADSCLKAQDEAIEELLIFNCIDDHQYAAYMRAIQMQVQYMRELLKNVSKNAGKEIPDGNVQSS